MTKNIPIKQKTTYNRIKHSKYPFFILIQKGVAMPELEPLLESDESEAVVPEIAIRGAFGSYEPSVNLKKHKFSEEDSKADTNTKNELFVQARLGDKLTVKLHAGIDQYIDNEKAGAIEAYTNKYTELAVLKPNSPTYFRDQLSAYIKKRTITPYAVKEPDLRKSQPEKEAITLHKLLGDQGVALYKRALLEERYSRDYVNAVFVESTVPVEGEPWNGKRPVVIVAGPSGCGKSRAAAAALEQTNHFIPTIESGPKDTNFAVFSDGGIERELSQIRKIAIQLATNNGYTGVSDLEPNSKVDIKVKTCIFDAITESKTLGIVMPETFAGKGFEKITELQKKPNNVVVFTRVEGQNPSIFKKVVAFLGARRAFKASGFDKVSANELFLNITGLPESKVYDSWGFWLGKRGSKNAEDAFIASKPDSLSMIITNDLVLKKYENGDWRDGEQGEPGIVLVSNRVFQKWQTLSESEQLSEGFSKCCGTGKKQITETEWNALSKVEQLNKALDQYNNDHGKSIIHTRGQMDLLILKIQMNKHVTYLQQPKNSNPENDRLRAGLEKILATLPEQLSEGGLKIEAHEIKKMQDAIDVYRDDLGPKRAKKLDAAMSILSSEVKLRTFKTAPAPVEETVKKQQAILTDVRSFSEFKTEKININSTEYKAATASTASTASTIPRSQLAQVQAQEVHYEGYSLKDDERIVSQMKVENGHARLEQTKSGSVEDHCSGTLSKLESQVVALKQAQMALNNYNPEKGKIVLRGKDVEQSQRLYAAVMYLALNDPELKAKMKSGMFSSDPAQLINCRVSGVTFPGKMERNSDFINRHLPDLKEIIRANSLDGINVLSSGDKKKIDLELKTKKASETDTTHPFRVFKERYKFSVQPDKEELSSKPTMK